MGSRASNQKIYVVYSGITKTIVAPDPVVNDRYIMFRAHKDLTITNVFAVVEGTTPSVTIKLTHDPDASATGTEILATPVAITSTTTGQNLVTFNDSTIPEGSWIVLELTALSGVVNLATVMIVFDYD